MNKKNTLRLTESDLHKIIKESVKRILIINMEASLEANMILKRH